MMLIKCLCRWDGLRGDILKAIEEGEVGKMLWDWCERETVEYK